MRYHQRHLTFYESHAPGRTLLYNNNNWLHKPISNYETEKTTKTNVEVILLLLFEAISALPPLTPNSLKCFLLLQSAVCPSDLFDTPMQ